MPNPMKNPIIKKLVEERLDMIQKSTEAYIMYNNHEEKITNVELKESENFARIILMTDKGTTFVLTPAEFLKKTIRVENKVMRGR
ncbi:hypothetical protein AFV8_gp01 [Betalipothrixvirus puteoliense]|uniref:Uncharacterized protein n=1 Tax=Betalipothrixvirus puteoliense TaxID=346884 RepID=A7WKT1_9VIRU|nr:hypothetical protein AFV8_gp01 [Acidianus filamentous virus 8]CAJ31678.1 conserved hypothetical protein [Acidianus filamentous virus 8]